VGGAEAYAVLKKEIKEAMKPDLKDEMDIVKNKDLNSDHRIRIIENIPPFEEVAAAVKAVIVGVAKDDKDDPEVRNTALNRPTKDDIEDYDALKKAIQEAMKPAFEKTMKVIRDMTEDKGWRIWLIESMRLEEVARQVKTDIMAIAKNNKEDPFVRNAAINLLAKEDIENYDAVKKEIDDAMKPGLERTMKIIMNKAKDRDLRIFLIETTGPFEDVKAQVKIDIMALAADKTEDPFVRNTALNRLTQEDIENYDVLKDEIEDLMKPDLKDVMRIVTSKRQANDFRIYEIENSIPPFEEVQRQVKATIVTLARDKTEDPFVRNAAFGLLTKEDVEDYDALETDIREALRPTLGDIIRIITDQNENRGFRMFLIEKRIAYFEEVTSEVKEALVTLAGNKTDDPFVRNTAFSLLTQEDIENYDAVKKEIEEAMKPALEATTKIIMDKSQGSGARIFLIKNVRPFNEVAAQVKAAVVAVAKDTTEDPFVRNAALNRLTKEDVEDYEAVRKEIYDALEEALEEPGKLDFKKTIPVIKDMAEDKNWRIWLIESIPLEEVTLEVKVAIMDIAANVMENPRVRKAAFNLLNEKDIKNYAALAKEIDKALRPDLKDEMGVITSKNRDSDYRIYGIKTAIPPFGEAAPEVKAAIVAIAEDSTDDPKVRDVAFSLLNEGDVEDYSALKEEIEEALRPDLRDTMKTITDKGEDKIFSRFSH